jgi:hypothetical protein
MLSKLVSETDSEELNTKYLKQGEKRFFSSFSEEWWEVHTHTWALHAAFIVYVTYCVSLQHASIF